MKAETARVKAETDGVKEETDGVKEETDGVKEETDGVKEETDGESESWSRVKSPSPDYVYSASRVPGQIAESILTTINTGKKSEQKMRGG